MSKGTEDAERQLWEALAALPPPSVCERAGVTGDGDTVFTSVETLRYSCTSFGQKITVDVRARELAAESPAGQLLLGRLAYFSRLALLHYLVNAKDVPLSGQWVAPSELSAAQLYFRGSHVLPLDRLAALYGPCPERFLAQGARLGGERIAHGDAAVGLLPLPRVPILLVLWTGDDEFPARANLLFDSTCKLHLAPDIVWSTAMMTTLLMTLDLGT